MDQWNKIHFRQSIYLAHVKGKLYGLMKLWF